MMRHPSLESPSAAPNRAAKRPPFAQALKRAIEAANREESKHRSIPKGRSPLRRGAPKDDDKTLM